MCDAGELRLLCVPSAACAALADLTARWWPECPLLLRITPPYRGLRTRRFPTLRTADFAWRKSGKKRPRFGRKASDFAHRRLCVAQIRKERAPIRPESFRLCVRPTLRGADPEIAGPTARPTARPMARPTARLGGGKSAGDLSQSADLSQRDECGNVAAGEGKRGPVASAHTQRMPVAACGTALVATGVERAREVVGMVQ